MDEPALEDMSLADARQTLQVAAQVDMDLRISWESASQRPSRQGPSSDDSDSAPSLGEELDATEDNYVKKLSLLISVLDSISRGALVSHHH